MAVQIIGAIAGVIFANLMFDEPAVFFSQKHRFGPGQWLGEFVATFGLLSVIQGCARLRRSAVPFAVGGYITAAYWFTSSTSFANPAVTIARTLSDTFAGIHPMHAPAFIVMQFIGAGAGSQSKGEINPHTIEILKKLNYVTDGLRSKSWDEFAVPGAPEMQFVFTVCDRAAQEVCPPS